MKIKNKKAFTLIELLVVMSVIGILVLLAIPRFVGYTEKARLTELKSNIKQLENASERYYIEKQDWPRLSDEPYTAEQLETFAQEIKDKTGATTVLDSDGKYYEIDYNKLQKYVQKPKNNIHYIIQNPIGEVYYLNNLTEEGKTTLYKNNIDEEIPKEVEVNQKPIAIINMTPQQDLTVFTNITWDSNNSTDPDGDSIVATEWQLDDGNILSNAPNGVISSNGTHTMKLRVKDSKGTWSDWVEKSFTIKSISEHVSKSLKFDGTSQYATISNKPNINFTYNQDFTVEFWVKVAPTQLDTGLSDNSIIEKWEGSNGYPYVFRFYRESGQISVIRYNLIETSYVKSTYSINDNQWHHIAGVKRGNILELYVDGQLQGSAVDLSKPETSNQTALYIGKRGTNKNYFTGNITDLRIWNIGRTESQIKDNRITEFNGKEPNLVGYWRINEGQGNIIYDKTSTKNNGQIYASWQNN